MPAVVVPCPAVRTPTSLASSSAARLSLDRSVETRMSWSVGEKIDAIGVALAGALVWALGGPTCTPRAVSSVVRSARRRAPGPAAGSSALVPSTW